MARTRRRGQQVFEFRTWGGKRRGAGRKQVNAVKSQPHRTRPSVSSSQAVHVTLRIAADFSRLRRRDAYRAVRKAMVVVLPRTNFRIVHASVQANHVHLMTEADSKMALARGLQAFQISAAKRLNHAESARHGRKRSGPAFPDRYHAEVISTPFHARRALAYVLNNWRKHKEDRAPGTSTWILDPYSSAVSFTGWTERSKWDVPTDHEPLPVCLPHSWLLREGWKKYGTISVFEVPGQR
jgi:REP element-mobilizing transposase RayT